VLPVVLVFRIFFPPVDQRRFVPLVIVEMQFSISLVAVLPPLEKGFDLRFLAGLHPLWNNVGKPALTDHFQDVLTIELPIYQHVIDVNEVICRIQ